MGSWIGRTREGTKCTSLVHFAGFLIEKCVINADRVKHGGAECLPSSGTRLDVRVLLPCLFTPKINKKTEYHAAEEQSPTLRSRIRDCHYDYNNIKAISVAEEARPLNPETYHRKECALQLKQSRVQ